MEELVKSCDESEKFEAVFKEEKNKIEKKEKLIGLALSGGGIRSATFNLGIIQALANRNLLTRFDYLSTVSGGSYIGSWLISWAYREQEKAKKDHANPMDRGIGIAKVQSILKDNCNPHQHTEAEPKEVSWLRQYSNYLTPRKGLFALDTLTAATYHFRNIFLSSLVVGLFLFAAMSLLVAVMLFIDTLQVANFKLLCFGIVVGISAIAWVWFRLPLVSAELIKNENGEVVNASYSGSEKTIWYIASLIVFSTFAIGIFGTTFAIGIFGIQSHIEQVIMFVLLGFGYLSATILGVSIAYLIQLNNKKISAKVNWKWLSFSALLGSIPFFAFGYYFSEIMKWLIRESALGKWIFPVHTEPSIWGLSGIVVPIICLLFSFLVSIHLGIVGRAISSEAYFWVSRVAARITKISFFFAFPAMLLLFFPPLLDWSETTLAIGGISAVYTLVVRWLAASSETGSDKVKQMDWKKKLIECIVSIAPYILVLILIGFISLGVRNTFEPLGVRNFTDHLQELPQNYTPSYSVFFLQNLVALDSIKILDIFCTGLITLFLAIILGNIINANLFSLHPYYRNRLTNAYLAASNRKGIKRDIDIGIHPSDAIALADFAMVKPYLLVNTTLNLSGKKIQLAWQDRKAASFVMSPLYCGYAIESMRDGYKEYYRKTDSYAIKNRQTYQTTSDQIPNEYFLKLDLAMTISGAAVSPLWGFHTKPGVSMFLALTGMRLGWWLPNPATDEWFGKFNNVQWRSSTPLLTTISKEMRSKADENCEYIYLSDGGHFENLGIYELVKRRCALIVASDAGEDSQFNFDDLANAIHKIRVDFGIEIEIDVSNLRPDEISEGRSPAGPTQNIRFSQSNFVIGKIRYNRSPKEEFKKMEDGVLIYIKSSLPKSAQLYGTDVLYYAAMNKNFPHESTLYGQWFGEDQFEAYRKIGFLIGEDAAITIDQEMGKLN